MAARRPIAIRRSLLKGLPALVWAAASSVRAQTGAPKPERARVSVALNEGSALYQLPLTVAAQLGYEFGFGNVASMARRFGITLVGFLREGRFNVYAGRERVLLPGDGGGR